MDTRNNRSIYWIRQKKYFLVYKLLKYLIMNTMYSAEVKEIFVKNNENF